MICLKPSSRQFCIAYLYLAFFLASAFTWAQDNQSPQESTKWDSFDSLLMQLENEIQTSNERAERLELSLQASTAQLNEASTKLASLETQLSDQSSLLKQSAQLVTSLEKQLKYKTVEVWIWRGATGLAIIGLIWSIVK